MSAIRKEFAIPHLNRSTGGQGVDRPPVEQELEAETGRIRRLHALLTAELAAATAQARGSLAAVTGDELSARWERDVSVHRWSERVSALTAARSGLCFGRLDHTDGSTTYIGRIGLTDPADGESALVDWRAPASRPFYCATLATPLGLTRRRHFEIAGMAPDERVADFHDDVLDGDTDSGSASDPALLAALKAPRGSTMRDIVTTIQAEQDAIIRLPLSGRRRDRGRAGHRQDRRCAAPRRLPALHPPRAAGPQRRAGRRPQRRVHPVRRGRAPRAGRVGRGVHDARPAGARRRRDRRRSGRRGPHEGRAGDAGRPAPRRRGPAGAARGADRDRARRRHGRDRPGDGGRGRRRARATGLPHNAARTTFRDTLGSLLVSQGVERLEQNLEDPPELADLLRGLGDLPEIEPAGAAEVSAEMRHELRDDLRSDLGFHAAVEQLWPALTPEQALTELFGSRERLSAAGADPGLHRAEGSPWTVADAPLLDELAELLGTAPGQPGRQGESDRAYAAEVLNILESADRQLAGEDADEVRPTDFVTADVLAARQAAGRVGTVAERAAADRDWRYGHLVVDEAQELSAMDWHVLLRRCPSRSITAVGDLAQRSASAGAHEWADVFAPHLGSRWTYRTLTVNYRTPWRSWHWPPACWPGSRPIGSPRSRSGRRARSRGSAPCLRAIWRPRCEGPSRRRWRSWVTARWR